MMEYTTITFVSSLQVEDSQPPLPLWGIKIPWFSSELLSSRIWRFLSPFWKLQVPQPFTHMFYSWMLGFDCLTVQDHAMSCVDHMGFFQGKIILSSPCSGDGQIPWTCIAFPPPQLWVCSQASGFRPEWTSSRWIYATKASFWPSCRFPPQESVKGQQWVISVIPFPSYCWAESNPAPVHEVATFVTLTEELGCKYITCFKMFTTCFCFY